MSDITLHELPDTGVIDDSDYSSFGQTYPEIGRIHFPDFIDSVNIIEEYVSSQTELLSPMRQWQKVRDFHRASFNINLACDEAYLGATEFRLNIEVVGDGGTIPPQMDSIGPETAWIANGVSAEGTLKIGTGLLGDLLKLTPVGVLPLPEGDITFNYKWNPKVAQVITGASGRGAQWVLHAREGVFLDGNHEFMAIIRRPRNVTNLRFKVTYAWVQYRKGWSFGLSDAFQREGLPEIPINITESTPGVDVIAGS